MYKAVKLEAFYDFAEKHGNMKGNVLHYAIKQPKGSLDNVFGKLIMGHLIKIAKHATRYTTATSMATQQQQEALFKEGRILLSLNAYRLGNKQAVKPALTTMTTQHIVTDL